MHSTGPGSDALASQEFRDQHALNLAGAFSNFIDFDATPVTRNGIFIHKTIAAVDLYRLVCCSLGCFRGKEFCDRRLSRVGLMLHMQPGSFIVGQTRKFYLCIHVSKLKLYGLELAELFP